MSRDLTVKAVIQKHSSFNAFEEYMALGISTKLQTRSDARKCSLPSYE